MCFSVGNTPTFSYFILSYMHFFILLTFWTIVCYKLIHRRPICNLVINLKFQIINFCNRRYTLHTVHPNENRNSPALHLLHNQIVWCTTIFRNILVGYSSTISIRNVTNVSMNSYSNQIFARRSTLVIWIRLRMVNQIIRYYLLQQEAHIYIEVSENTLH